MVADMRDLRTASDSGMKRAFSCFAFCSLKVARGVFGRKTENGCMQRGHREAAKMGMLPVLQGKLYAIRVRLRCRRRTPDGGGPGREGLFSRTSPKQASTKPKPMRATPDGEKVARSGSRIGRAWRRLKRLAKPQNEYSTDDEKERGGGEGGLEVEGRPQEADEETGDEVANGVDGGEGAEGHAVLLLGNQFGGERVFERLFGADVETSQNKNHREQP